MQHDIYSVRMRAAKGGKHEEGGKHISGGEKLVPYPEVKDRVITLVDKALTHSRGNPDFLQVQVELVRESLTYLSPLHSQTNRVSSFHEGRVVAANLLEKCGIHRKVIHQTFTLLEQHGGLRGAIIFDIHSDKRIDTREKKGIRVSRMDWEQQNFERWAEKNQLPLTSRVKEAMTLATKVANHSDTVAELCWSDDPDYITGYVASKKLGYQRISKLKEYGDKSGGRVFFVNRCKNIEAYIDYLEKKPIFLDWGVENDTQIN
ncbi:6-carboxyhexanoate--CoA ligase [Bacillus solitudinis]|uniref:6-carboxyhexanoate--CoA ligase n=1 Tax=Bacillus solitudinis TaxID=2014074 RepID=UPI000C2390B6|nr:6-carboxyhexanoate--CoA ligase [Bacillus solitudinis]